MVWGDYFSPQFNYIKISFYACDPVTSPGVVCQDPQAINNYLATNSLQFIFQDSFPTTSKSTTFHVEQSFNAENYYYLDLS